MADQKLTELTELTAPTSDDIIYIVDAPGGTPLSRKMTVANLLAKPQPQIVTAYANAKDSHTTNSAWEDINSMSVTITPLFASAKLLCTFTVRVQPKSSNWEYIAFRFLLDGATGSEVWSRTKDNTPADLSQVYLLEMHSVFEGVSAAAHTVEAQWYDGGSQLDVDIFERRLTVMSCQ